jgi:hypothetical protein
MIKSGFAWQNNVIIIRATRGGEVFENCKPKFDKVHSLFEASQQQHQLVTPLLDRSVDKPHGAIT